MIHKFQVTLPMCDDEEKALSAWKESHMAKGNVLIDVQTFTRESRISPTTKMRVYLVEDGDSILEEAALTIPSKQR